MSKDSISLYWHLKKKQGRSKWFWIGTILNFLLIFLLSMNFYFRPYYQHKNNFRDKNTFTVETIGEINSFDSEDVLYSFAKQNAEKDLADLKLKEKCVSYNCTYYFTSDLLEISYLFIEQDFNVRNLGYLPDSIVNKIKNGKNLLISREKSQAETIKNNTDLFHDEFDIAYYDSNDYRGMIPFNPTTRANLFILPLSYRKSYRNKNLRYSIYYTYHLDRDLKDSEFNRLCSLGGGSNGRIIPIFQCFLHPAKDFYASYIPIKRTIRILLYICTIILAVSLFASFLTDYLKRSDHLEETRRREIFGMNESKFVFVQNTSITLSLFLSEIFCLTIYAIFRIIFEHIAGFGFYFNALFLLLFIGETIFSILTESIFSVLIYRKA